MLGFFTVLGMATALAIIFVLLTVLFIGGILATNWNKSVDEEQIESERRGLESLDKTLKSKDDPKEPARWVP